MQKALAFLGVGRKRNGLLNLPAAYNSITVRTELQIAYLRKQGLFVLRR
jgi:hypothetical protein